MGTSMPRLGPPAIAARRSPVLAFKAIKLLCHSQKEGRFGAADIDVSFATTCVGLFRKIHTRGAPLAEVGPAGFRGSGRGRALVHGSERAASHGFTRHS